MLNVFWLDFGGSTQGAQVGLALDLGVGVRCSCWDDRPGYVKLDDLLSMYRSRVRARLIRVITSQQP